MRQVDLVFVVCTYGSHEDLLNFIDSVNELNVKSAIVVANSFCSEETRDVIKKHAEERGCDFLDLPNKGYGHSLNEGIEYARKNYEFKYLAITNADILVKKFDLNIEDKACVFAPEVITKTGKKQNPFYIFQYRKTFLFARWAKDHFLKIFKYSVMVKAKIHRVKIFYIGYSDLCFENLKYAKELGYKTIFWSYAYADWDNNRQPDPQKAKEQILLHTHPGMVILLHPTSKTNADIMDDLLSCWEQQGYRSGTLEELTS